MNEIPSSQISLLENVEVTEKECETQTTYSRTVSDFNTPSDVTTDDTMSAIEASGTLDFWNDPTEDIYDEQAGNGN